VTTAAATSPTPNSTSAPHQPVTTAPPVTPALPARAATPKTTWPAILIEGESDRPQDVALALADDDRVAEVFWIDWTSGLADQWANGSRVKILDRRQPTTDWDKQLGMLDRVAKYGRHVLDTTGKPIAVIIDSVTDLYAEHRRWARSAANNVPKVRHALSQFPGIDVPIPGHLWDEIENRQADFLRAVNGIPGITLLLASGALRVVDGDGAALAVPEYKVDAHRIILRRVHAQLRVDHTGAAFPVKVPPLWRDQVDRTQATTVAQLVFDLFGLDPATAIHHTGP